jgi:hypothetical protein
VAGKSQKKLFRPEGTAETKTFSIVPSGQKLIPHFTSHFVAG